MPRLEKFVFCRTTIAPGGSDAQFRLFTSIVVDGFPLGPLDDIALYAHWEILDSDESDPVISADLYSPQGDRLAEAHQGPAHLTVRDIQGPRGRFVTRVIAFKPFVLLAPGEYRGVMAMLGRNLGEATFRAVVAGSPEHGEVGGGQQVDFLAR